MMRKLAVLLGLALAVPAVARADDDDAPPAKPARRGRPAGAHKATSAREKEMVEKARRGKGSEAAEEGGGSDSGDGPAPAKRGRMSKEKMEKYKKYSKKVGGDEAGGSGGDPAAGGKEKARASLERFKAKREALKERAKNRGVKKPPPPPPEDAPKTEE